MNSERKWNRSNPATSVQTERPRPKLRGLVAGLLVVVIAAIACIFLIRNGERPADLDEPDEHDAVIAPVKPAKVLREEAATQEVAKTELNVRRWGHSSNVPSSDTNRVHKANACEVKVVDADGNERVLKSVSPFKHRIDSMVWAAIRPAGMPSGLRALRTRMLHQTGSDAAFMEALRTIDIPIEKTDTAEIINAKEQTKAAKQELVKLLEGGADFDDVLRDVEKTVSKERLTERISQNELRDLIRQGDPKAVREYVNLQNEILRERGLRELRMPSFAQDPSDQPAAQDDGTDAAN